jgi:hypothetical protein
VPCFILPGDFQKRKSPVSDDPDTGDDITRGSTPVTTCCMLTFLTYNVITSFDDNGITGPDWGHSELVFHKRFIRLLPPLCSRKGILLCHVLLMYSSLQRFALCFNITHYRLEFEKIKSNFQNFIVRSRICTSYRFRKDMDHYVQPSCQR